MTEQRQMWSSYRDPTCEERAYYDRRADFEMAVLDRIAFEPGTIFLAMHFIIQPIEGEGVKFGRPLPTSPLYSGMYGIFLGRRSNSLLMESANGFLEAQTELLRMAAALRLSGLDDLDTEFIRAEAG